MNVLILFVLENNSESFDRDRTESWNRDHTGMSHSGVELTIWNLDPLPVLIILLEIVGVL